MRLELATDRLQHSISHTCPRRESNPHLRFRKPPFYPLNYGDGALRAHDQWPIADSQARKRRNNSREERMIKCDEKRVIDS